MPPGGELPPASAVAEIKHAIARVNVNFIILSRYYRITRDSGKHFFASITLRFEYHTKDRTVWETCMRTRTIQLAIMRRMGLMCTFRLRSASQAFAQYRQVPPERSSGFAASPYAQGTMVGFPNFDRFISAQRLRLGLVANGSIVLAASQVAMTECLNVKRKSSCEKLRPRV